MGPDRQTELLLILDRQGRHVCLLLLLSLSRVMHSGGGVCMRVSEAGDREDFPVERDEDELRVGDVCKGVRGRKNSKQQLTDTRPSY